MRYTKILLPLLLVVMVLSGCATTVRVNVQRPAEFDLPGVESVSVLPFKTEKPTNFFFFFRWVTTEETEASRLANHFTAELSSLFLNNDYFTLKDWRAVQSAMDNGQTIPCDVYLTGYIDSYDSHIERDRRSSKDKDGNTNYWTEYRRVASAKFVFELVDAKTNQVLYMDTDTLSNNSPYEKNEYRLPTGDDLLNASMKALALKIVKKMQPYYETVYYSLLEDKSKDSDMKYASELANSGHIEDATRVFLDVYDRTGKMEAGYNAAVLYQAQGKYSDARDLMEDVVDRYHDKKAMRQLTSIKQDLANQIRLKNQIDSRGGTSL